MKETEAICRIYEHMGIHKLREPQSIKISEALDMAASALTKQIPKYIQSSDDEDDEILCPSCSKDLMGCVDADYADGICYCPYCGQKLQW